MAQRHALPWKGLQRKHFCFRIAFSSPWISALSTFENNCIMGKLTFGNPFQAWTGHEPRQIFFTRKSSERAAGPRAHPSPRPTAPPPARLGPLVLSSRRSLASSALQGLGQLKIFSSVAEEVAAGGANERLVRPHPSSCPPAPLTACAVPWCTRGVEPSRCNLAGVASPRWPYTHGHSSAGRLKRRHSPSVGVAWQVGCGAGWIWC